MTERIIQSRPRGRVQVRLSFDEGTSEMFEALQAMALQARAPYLYYLVRLGQTVQSTLLQGGTPMSSLASDAAPAAAPVLAPTTPAAPSALRTASQHVAESLSALNDWAIDPGLDFEATEP